jgi:L-amino acid N-acyltransferase
MASPPPSVRDARAEDLAAIFEIYNGEVEHGIATFDTEPRILGRDDAWLTERDAERHPVVVALLDERVAGWASLNPWSTRGAYARTVEASVYVHADHRGQGLGKLLLAALVERARRAGAGVVLARITEANASSVGLFRSFGFARIGTQRRCGEKFGRILDVELMDLHLDAG